MGNLTIKESVMQMNLWLFFGVGALILVAVLTVLYFLWREGAKRDAQNKELNARLEAINGLLLQESAGIQAIAMVTGANDRTKA